MNKKIFKEVRLILWLLFLLNSTQAGQKLIPLSIKTLEPINVKIEEVKYKGFNAVRLTGDENGVLAIIKRSEFHNGIIEIEVAGNLLPGADTTFRGFIGVAFRLQKIDSLRYECFYIRPTNGRAEDQLRRNHSTQYISAPDYPWFKLRKDNPGVYESYVDLVAGEWTKLKIVVKNNEARLYVHNSSQPCLIVKDLKMGNVSGALGLWIGLGTEGYFRNLKVFTN